MTISAALDEAAARLRAAGIAEPRGDGRLLMSSALGLNREAILGEPRRPIDCAELARFHALISRRCDREPVSRILGRREFWSLPLTIDPTVFDPRPDSETLVEAALEALRGRRGAALRLLDLGTGSGCLLLALLSELPNAHGIGIDASGAALARARMNAHDLGMGERCRFVAGRWGAPIRGSFDVILCNPPYIRRHDIGALDAEVARFEPRLALDGGADGLDCYRAIIPQLPRFLASDGLTVVEVGHDQAGAVAALLHKETLGAAQVRRDLSGVDRCIVAMSARASNGEKR